MKTLDIIAQELSDVVKTEGGLELITSLTEELREKIQFKEELLLKTDYRFKEMAKLEITLLQAQLDMLCQKKWKF